MVICRGFTACKILVVFFVVALDVNTAASEFFQLLYLFVLTPSIKSSFFQFCGTFLLVVFFVSRSLVHEMMVDRNAAVTPEMISVAFYLVSLTDLSTLINHHIKAKYRFWHIIQQLVIKPKNVKIMFSTHNIILKN